MSYDSGHHVRFVRNFVGSFMRFCRARFTFVMILTEFVHFVENCKNQELVRQSLAGEGRNTVRQEREPDPSVNRSIQRLNIPGSRFRRENRIVRTRLRFGAE